MKDLNNKVERMTSIEIAEVTGKQHKNVMQAIRNMEPAWEKICGLKFQLTSRTISMPNGGTRIEHCYSLTKTECLYIATKFNDEARAKLVLRWEQLERERINVEVRMPMPVHCLLSLFTQLLHTYHGLPMKSAKIIRVNPCYPWSSKKICEICVFNIIATSVMV